MTARNWAGLVAALAMAMPSVPAAGRSITVSLCNGGHMTIPLPEDPDHPDDGSNGCCGKACHSSSDRRKRGDQEDTPCC